MKFRDLLRMDPVLANQYAREKERLALLNSGDRDAYQREKDKIVQSILARSTIEELPNKLLHATCEDARA
jgi:GrpB-like predicted nucleotidyltransferase (UPF0157 family)